MSHTFHSGQVLSATMCLPGFNSPIHTRRTLVDVFPNGFLPFTALIEATCNNNRLTDATTTILRPNRAHSCPTSDTLNDKCKHDPIDRFFALVKPDHDPFKKFIPSPEVFKSSNPTISNLGR